MRMNAEPIYRRRSVPEFRELQTMPYMTRQEKLLPMTRAIGGPSPSISVTPPSGSGAVSDEEIARFGEVMSPVGMPSRILSPGALSDEEIAMLGEILSPVGMPARIAPLRQQIPMRTTPPTVR